ncbi:MAG: hypothetical protein ACI87O_002878 [Planctomycetota bacterium]|jgi:hypothetical protein
MLLPLLVTLALSGLTTPALEPQPVVPAPAEISWFAADYNSAITAAKDQKKYLFTYYWANTETCIKLYGSTMGEAEVVEALSDFVCFSADASQDSGRAMLDRRGFATVPVMVISGPDGLEEDAIVGFITGDRLVQELERIQKGEGTISYWRAQCAKEAIDTDHKIWRLEKLAEKLKAVGAKSALESVQADLEKADPAGKSQRGGLIMANKLINEMKADEAVEPTKWNTKPVDKFLSKVPNLKARFDGYYALGSSQINAGLYSDGLRSALKAWKKHPKEGPLLAPNLALLQALIPKAGELSKKERKQALELAWNGLEFLEDEHGDHCKNRKCSKEGDLCAEWDAYHAALKDRLTWKEYEKEITWNRPLFTQWDVIYLVAAAENAFGSQGKAEVVMGRVQAIQGTAGFKGYQAK